MSLGIWIAVSAGVVGVFIAVYYGEIGHNQKNNRP